MIDIRVVSDAKGQDADMDAIFAALEKLENTEVLIGIPEDEGARQDGDGINNAQLLYIHTHGSAVNNIPARPVIEPAIEDDKNIIGDLLGQAAQAAMDGNEGGMMAALEKAGMRGQNAARDWFDNPKNSWKANTPETIERKGSAKPLIDTSELRKSIIYVVEEKES